MQYNKEVSLVSYTQRTCKGTGEFSLNQKEDDCTQADIRYYGIAVSSIEATQVEIAMRGQLTAEKSLLRKKQ